MRRGRHKTEAPVIITQRYRQKLSVLKHRGSKKKEHGRATQVQPLCFLIQTENTQNRSVWKNTHSEIGTRKKTRDDRTKKRKISKHKVYRRVRSDQR